MHRTSHRTTDKILFKSYYFLHRPSFKMYVYLCTFVYLHMCLSYDNKKTHYGCGEPERTLPEPVFEMLDAYDLEADDQPRLRCMAMALQ